MAIPTRKTELRRGVLTREYLSAMLGKLYESTVTGDSVLSNHD
jgi:hypothetical protein